MSRFGTPLPAVDRCQAFWERAETDRPLLATWVGSYQFPDLFPIGLAQLKQGQLDPEDLVFETFRQDYENLFNTHAQAAVDVPWAAFPLALMPWAEAIAGCPIIHRSGNIWAEAWIKDCAEFEQQGGFNLNQAWLDKLVEFTQSLVELADGRFPVAVSLLRGPADILAAARGAQDSVLDLIDSPEPVERLLDGLTDLWITVARAQQAHIPVFAGGYGWNLQNLWSPRPGGWFQDDAIAFWSPRLYQRYAAPREERLSRSLPVTGCHLHSSAIFMIDDLLKMPDLDLIEMNLDTVGMTVPEMIPYFQRVLDQTRLYVWGRFSSDDLQAIRTGLPARGLALQLMDDTPEAVQAMYRQVRELWTV
jgi:hypothetical protein